MAGGSTSRGVSWLGLVTGPLAWAISTQLNYVLVPWSCSSDTNIVAPVALGLVCLALVGGLFSWRAQVTGGAAIERDRKPHTEMFVARMGLMASVLFALVITLQGAAAFFLHGCTR